MGRSPVWEGSCRPAARLFCLIRALGPVNFPEKGPLPITNGASLIQGARRGAVTC